MNLILFVESLAVGPNRTYIAFSGLKDLPEVATVVYEAKWEGGYSSDNLSCIYNPVTGVYQVKWHGKEVFSGSKRETIAFLSFTRVIKLEIPEVFVEKKIPIKVRVTVVPSPKVEFIDLMIPRLLGYPSSGWEEVIPWRVQ